MGENYGRSGEVAQEGERSKSYAHEKGGAGLSRGKALRYGLGVVVVKGS